MIKKLLAVTCLMMSMAVHSATVTVGGTDYDVSTVTTSFNNFSATLQAQTWHGNKARAEDFALATGGLLDELNTIGIFEYIPFFAFNNTFFSHTSYTQFSDLSASGIVTLVNDVEYVYAIATVTPVPIPAAAWLFGSALLGLGALKRRKA